MDLKRCLLFHKFHNRHLRGTGDLDKVKAGRQHAYASFPPRTYITDKAIGAGMPNTNKLITDWGTYSYAAIACGDLVVNGYDDWFLPSVDELTVLNNNKAILGLKTGVDDFYWTSTDVNGCCNYA